MPETHPSAKELADYDAGKLPAGPAGRVAAHVEGCAECQGLLSRRAPGGTALPSGKTSPSAPPGPDGPPLELATSGKYEVLGKLGEGGMGAVWKAHQTWLGRVVAIKVLGGAALDHPEARDRFRQEMLACGRLDHPNIVKTHDAEQVGDTLLLVMEYIEGVSLDRLVKQKGPLPVPFSCRCVGQAAEGLQYAHERGLVHRDVKPANLMVLKDRTVKVLDFGLARQAADKDEARKTQFRAFMGTADYVAPEQAVNARDADIRSDIYSLGCTLYFLLSGKPPFEGDSAYEVAAAQMTDEPTPLPNVPPPLWAVIARMMAKKPSQRYQTPAEVVVALRPFTAKREPAEGVSVLPLPPPEAPPRRGRWRRWWLLPAAGAAGAAVGLAARLLSGGPRDEGGGKPEPPPAAKSVVIATPSREPEKLPPPKPLVPGDLAVAEPKETLPGKPATPPPADPEADPSPREVAALPPFARRVNSVFLFPGGQMLLAVQLGPPPAESSYWDWGTRRRVGTLANRHKDALHGVAVSPSGRLVATWGGNVKRPESWEVILTSVDSGATLMRRPLGATYYGWFAFDPAERRLASATGREDDLRLWDLAKGAELPRARPQEPSPGDGPRSEPKAISRSLRYAAVGSRDGRLRVWDTGSGKTLAAFRAASAQLNGVTFSPDERLVATLARDETPRVWDWAARREVFRVKGDPQHHFRMAFTPDGKRLLTGGAAGGIDLWELAGGRRLHRYPGHEGGVDALAVAADGQHFATSGAGDKTVRVWALPR
ncbi:MAG: protein kinase [Gemmataceae bacterium]